MTTDLHLATENTFHAGYLVSAWGPELGGHLIIRDNRPDQELLKARDAFHDEHRGATELSDAGWRELAELYPDLGESDRAMVAAFGIPERAVTADPGAIYLGRDLNGPAARELVDRLWTGRAEPYLMVYLDRIFEPWWIERLGQRIVNGHTAVLPYARGMHTIEQIAATGDAQMFQLSAGATVHFVVEDVDQGPIIRAERLREPFGYPSIWACKAQSLHLAFELLIGVAREIRSGRTEPVGLTPAPVSRTVEYRRRQFDSDVAAAAVAGYLAMKSLAQAPV
ncbi:formyltransferase family protein [Actinoplanes sp. L3-i22]|uniref:formyltransferase family protein n=1 Tax=Actinoplanes sp. L3-i22 TaxID=2836373 RepID=UPI001C77D1C8|nr:formyltransferase family protein [Actinoplanes sp. L3-i22]BCY14209.1 hypothetical protein L3i22_092970 [Actinoplanes sp. L3-i22]